MSYDNVTPQGQPYIQFTSFSPTPSIPESITSPYSSNQISQSFTTNTYNVERNTKECITKKVVTRSLTPHKISLLILIKEFFHEKCKDILSPLLLFLINELNVK